MFELKLSGIKHYYLFKMFFLTKPEIDFDFDGLAKLADLPVIKKKIKEDLLKDLNEQAVYPNR